MLGLPRQRIEGRPFSDFVRKHKVTTDSDHKFNIAPNLLDRDFAAEKPNQKWAGDISYVWTREGWLYLSVILDLHSRRVLPVSFIAIDAAEVVHSSLERQLNAPLPNEHDGRFVFTQKEMNSIGLTDRELLLLHRIEGQVHPVGDVLRNRLEQGALKRLWDRGMVQVADITPSDANHVLGRLDCWDREAAEKALTLFSRRRIGSGKVLATGPQDLAEMIIEQLTKQTVLALLETAIEEDAEDFGLPAAQLARHVLMQRGLAGHRGMLSLDAALNSDVVGLGASAPVYYPAVGERLHCRMILLQHAGVANAIGAVVGRVSMRRSGTVSSPAERQFRVFLEDGPKDFNSSDAAMKMLEQVLSEQARQAAGEAGAEDIHVHVNRDIRTAQIESRHVFVEAVLTVEASDRPRVALG